jgi:hypothetical protein
MNADPTPRPVFSFTRDGLSYPYGYAVAGGYRTRLYSDLQNAAYSFTFVGTSTDNPSSLLSQLGQTHHQGHFGYRLDQIANNLDGNDGSNGNKGGFWFHRFAPPNIILLFIGGNDILQNFQTSTLATRLDKLIGQIVAAGPHSLLFVSNLYSPPALDATQNQLLQSYNTQIRDVIVPKYESLGDDVAFVDQASNFVDTNGNRIHFGSDNIHPDQAGYDLMADTWAAAIQQGAPIPEPSTTCCSPSACSA